MPSSRRSSAAVDARVVDALRGRAGRPGRWPGHPARGGRPRPERRAVVGPAAGRRPGGDRRPPTGPSCDAGAQRHHHRQLPGHGGTASSRPRHDGAAPAPAQRRRSADRPAGAPGRGLDRSTVDRRLGRPVRRGAGRRLGVPRRLRAHGGRAGRVPPAAAGAPGRRPGPDVLRAGDRPRRPGGRGPADRAGRPRRPGLAVVHDRRRRGPGPASRWPRPVALARTTRTSSRSA